MKYRVGEPGRIVVARFEDRDDVIQGIEDVVQKEGIKAGIVYLLGGIRSGKIVVGPEEDRMPPKPVWRDVADNHEMVGIGTIFWMDDKPRLHLHGAFGKGDTTKVGCLRESSSTFLILEAVVIEIKGITARRELDPLSGMALLKL